eukprot:gene494-8008_t
MIDELIEKVKKCELLTTQEIKKICILVKEILIEEPNVIPCQAPISICGNICGQYFDLLELFKISGKLPKTKYIFMGNYINRGKQSVETLTFLILLKIKYPKEIILLRGSFEHVELSKYYGFYDECNTKYNLSPFEYFMDTVTYFPLAAVVNGEAFCVHSGISPEFDTIEKIQTLNRVGFNGVEGPIIDLLHSDPEEIKGWQCAPKDSGFLFGSDILKQFNLVNDLDLFCRSHRLVLEGYQYMFEKSLVTVFSAPQYCGRCDNLAAVMKLDENMNQSFIQFEQAI